MTTIMLEHNRVQLALHALKAGEGRALLLLHGLGERSPAALPSEYSRWKGPVYALDFTGHGASTVPRGGGYTCELLMADADAALGRLSQATIVGRGLGAYVALLIAGGRPEQVRGAILRDGSGLAGGGAGATTPTIPHVDADAPAPPDPYAMVDLATDIRPPDYATAYARAAALFSGLKRPITVCTRERPDWLAAVVSELGADEASLGQALAHYAKRA
ncbi:MAG: alpha/beta hydrolase [Myxococcales bacterium]|nr:alpha/beta hydrolase [Myxococcales bacterium]